MACQRVDLGNGQAAIVCGPRQRRRKCCGCGRQTADLQCDWRGEDRSGKTCDRWICSRCTVSPAPDKDLCPDHAAAYEDWKKNRPTTRTP